MYSINDLDFIQREIFKSICDISYCIRNSNPIDLSSVVGVDNSSGDKVKELDMKCNNIIKNNLSQCSLIRYIGSEEEEELIEVNKSGKYLVNAVPNIRITNGHPNIIENIFPTPAP